MAQVVGISAVLVLLPLIVLRRRRLRAHRAGRSLLYFACLGTAFMLLEIGLIHRFVLLLGHQSYATTVVLLGLLLGAGLGSAASSRLPIDDPRTLRIAIGALAAIAFAYTLGLPTLFDQVAASPFAIRLALALTLLVTLGIFLGLPFPTALRGLAEEGSPLVPWAIGVNGFASVVGSTAAVVTAMVAGLRVVLLLAVALYLVAAMVIPFGTRRASRDGLLAAGEDAPA